MIRCGFILITFLILLGFLFIARNLLLGEVVENIVVGGGVGIGAVELGIANFE